MPQNLVNTSESLNKTNNDQLPTWIMCYGAITLKYTTLSGVPIVSSYISQYVT